MIYDSSIMWHIYGVKISRKGAISCGGFESSIKYIYIVVEVLDTIKTEKSCLFRRKKPIWKTWFNRT